MRHESCGRRTDRAATAIGMSGAVGQIFMVKFTEYIFGEEGQICQKVDLLLGNKSRISY
jgi:hypothetical protein